MTDATKYGFSIRDLKALGFHEIGSSDYSVNNRGNTNIERVHLIQPGLQFQNTAQLVDAFDAGEPFESREIETPFPTFSAIVNANISANRPPDNTANGPQNGELYLAEAYFKNPYDEEMWWQFSKAQCAGYSAATPRGQFMTITYQYRAAKMRIVYGDNRQALINGKP